MLSRILERRQGYFHSKKTLKQDGFLERQDRRLH